MTMNLLLITNTICTRNVKIWNFSKETSIFNYTDLNRNRRIKTNYLENITILYFI